MNIQLCITFTYIHYIFKNKYKISQDTNKCTWNIKLISYPQKILLTFHSDLNSHKSMLISTYQIMSGYSVVSSILQQFNWTSRINLHMHIYTWILAFITYTYLHYMYHVWFLWLPFPTQWNTKYIYMHTNNTLHPSSITFLIIPVKVNGI